VHNSNKPFSLSIFPSLFSFPSPHEQTIFELLLPSPVSSSSLTLKPVLPAASYRTSTTSPPASTVVYDCLHHLALSLRQARPRHRRRRRGSSHRHQGQRGPPPSPPRVAACSREHRLERWPGTVTPCRPPRTSPSEVVAGAHRRGALAASTASAHPPTRTRSSPSRQTGTRMAVA
jgi:hypothetical protein